MDHTDAREFSPNFSDSSSVFLNWLTILFWLQVASLVTPFLSYIPIVNVFYAFCSPVLSIALIVCLFQLSRTNRLYQTAAIFHCAALLLGAVIRLRVIEQLVLYPLMNRGAVVDPSQIFSLLAIVRTLCTLIATYLTFRGHSTSCSAADIEIHTKWNLLFGGIALSWILYYILPRLISATESQFLNHSVIWILGIFNVALDLVYLWYVHQMIQALSKK